MRHIIQPSVNYVYVPDPNVRPSELPQFDTEIPSLRLLPINFPDYNSIDAIDSQSVLRLVLSQGLRLTIAGVVGGLAIAVVMNRVLATLLFGVGPSDPVTMTAVVALMTVVATIACYLPARFATRVDPMVVLRED